MYKSCNLGFQDTSDCIICSEIIGDINNDNYIDILDIIHMRNCILLDDCNECSDINLDETINIQDIILLVEIILN